jgi:hypothetical protein
MSQQHAFSASCFDVVAVLGIAMALLWLSMAKIDVRDLGSRATLTVTGYLRPRPDPAAEQALRAAFAELDRDLAEILGDRTARGCSDC